MLVSIKRLDDIVQYMIFSKTINPMIHSDVPVTFKKISRKLYLIECKRIETDINISIVDDNLYTIVVPSLTKKFVITLTEIISESETNILEHSTKPETTQESSLFPIQILVHKEIKQQEFLSSLASKTKFVVYVLLITPPTTININNICLSVAQIDSANESITGRVTSPNYVYHIQSPTLFTDSDKNVTSFESFYAFSNAEFELRHINKSFDIKSICGVEL